MIAMTDEEEDHVNDDDDDNNNNKPCSHNRGRSVA
jgi:hypothetical protein